MVQQATITPPRFLLSVDEAAQSLHISRVGVYRLLKRGELRSVKVGGLRRISVMALQAYVDKLEQDDDQTREA